MKNATMNRRSIAVACLVGILTLFASAAPADPAKFQPIGAGESVAARYIVTLSERTEGQDPAAVAAELVAAYGGRLELYARMGFRGLAVVTSASCARLLSADDRVAFVEAVATLAAAPPAPAPSRPAAVTTPPLHDSTPRLTPRNDGAGSWSVTYIRVPANKEHK